MALGKNLATTIVAAVQHELSRYIDVFTAEITEVNTTGVKIKRVGETTGSNEIYARVSDLIYNVGDEVFVISIRNRPFVLGVVRRTTYPSPTATVLSAAGSGASCSIIGSDLNGTITFVAGSSSVSAGNVFTFNFAEAMPDATYSVNLTNGSNAAGDLQMRMNFTGRSTTGWNMNFRVAPTTGATYIWSYAIRPSYR